mmetsp:Transcript_41443/g.48321  ORF Transcript_41443/g.48321 Transcript_41443/m.48321 type:complete len:290 (-) Transcript_41443:84-953(-)
MKYLKSPNMFELLPKLERLDPIKASKEESIDWTISTQKSNESSQNSNSKVDGICIVTPRRLKSCMIVQTQQESLNERRHNDALLNARQMRAKRKPISVEDLSVTFSSVQMRVHRIQLGDNPSVRSGPALTVSWDHCPHFGTRTLPIDDYDNARRSNRRSLSDLVLPRQERTRLVRLSGHSKTEIRKAIKATNIIRQRRKSRNSSPYLVEIHDMISQRKTKVKKRLKNTLSLAFTSSNEHLPPHDINDNNNELLLHLDNIEDDYDRNDCNESSLSFGTDVRGNVEILIIA